MKHVINVANDKIQLQTKAADNNVCDHCKQPIKRFYENGKVCRDNREDAENESGDLVSYHLECFDMLVFGKITSVSVSILYRLEVKDKQEQPKIDNK